MDEITLENVSLKTFETLLQFAYSGTLNVGKVPLAVRCIHKQYIVLYVCGYAEPFLMVCILSFSLHHEFVELKLHS